MNSAIHTFVIRPIYQDEGVDLTDDERNDIKEYVAISNRLKMVFKRLSEQYQYSVRFL